LALGSVARTDAGFKMDLITSRAISLALVAVAHITHGVARGLKTAPANGSCPPQEHERDRRSAIRWNASQGAGEVLIDMVNPSRWRSCLGST